MSIVPVTTCHRKTQRDVDVFGHARSKKEEEKRKNKGKEKEDVRGHKKQKMGELEEIELWKK